MMTPADAPLSGILYGPYEGTIAVSGEVIDEIAERNGYTQPIVTQSDAYEDGSVNLFQGE